MWIYFRNLNSPAVEVDGCKKGEQLIDAMKEEAGSSAPDLAEGLQVRR